MNTSIRTLVVGAVVVIAIILGVVNRLTPRSVMKDTVDIPVDSVYEASVNSSKNSKMRVVVTPQGTIAGKYAVYIMDAPTHARMEAPGVDPGTLTHMAMLEGSGTLSLPQVALSVGSYYIMIENEGEQSIKVKYEVFEDR